MFIHNIDPVLFTLGPFSVRWYGLIYVLGFVLGYYFLIFLSRERKLPITKSDIESFSLWAILATVIGARVIYVLFYNLSYYIQNPIEVFYVWNGGLSFHGSLIGLTLVGLWFTKKHNISFYQLADLVVIPAALALAFGRIANFINGELVGRVADLPWSVKFPGFDDFRHPSQLYASAKNFLIFAVLWFSRNKNKPDGYLFWMFFTLYGLLRFVVGFFRAPDPQLGFIGLGLTMGQLLTIPMFVIGFIMLRRIRNLI